MKGVRNNLYWYLNVTLTLSLIYSTHLSAMHVTLATQPKAIELTSFGQSNITTLADGQEKTRQLKQLIYDLTPLPQDLINIIMKYDSCALLCINNFQVDYPTTSGQMYALNIVQPLQNNLIATGFFNGRLLIWDRKKVMFVFQVLPPDDDDWNGFWAMTPLPNNQLAIAADNKCSTINIDNLSDNNAPKTNHLPCIGECLDGAQNFQITAVTNFNNELFAIGSEHGVIQIRSPQGKEFSSVTGCIRSFQSGLSFDRSIGTCKKSLREHKKAVYALIAYPDDDVLASGSADGTIKIWDLTHNTCLHTITEHKGAITTLAKLPNHELASGADKDGNIHIWNIDTGERVHTLQTDSKGVFCLNMLTDNRLACLLKDGTVQIWDLNRMQCVQIIPCDEKAPIIDLKASADGTEIVTAHKDNSVSIWG